MQRPDPSDVPDYCYEAQVTNIVDGDTFDVRIDLGFETYITERIRTKDIDAREIHFVSHDSEEYERGMLHTRFVEDWVEKSRGEYEWPFILYSAEFGRGAYGRVIGDIYSKELTEWKAIALYENFDDVDRFE